MFHCVSVFVLSNRKKKNIEISDMFSTNFLFFLTQVELHTVSRFQ